MNIKRNNAPNGSAGVRRVSRNYTNGGRNHAAWNFTRDGRTDGRTLIKADEGNDGWVRVGTR